MLDLSLEAVHRFWFAYPDPSIYRVIAFLEGVEDWTVDGDPDFERTMEALAEILDQAGDYDLGNKDKFVNLVSHVKSGRGLRIMQGMDSAQPGSASRLLVYAEENTSSPDDEAGFFLRRNLAFERLRLLLRVFSKENFELILMALEEE